MAEAARIPRPGGSHATGAVGRGIAPAREAARIPPTGLDGGAAGRVGRGVRGWSAAAGLRSADGRDTGLRKADGRDTGPRPLSRSRPRARCRRARAPSDESRHGSPGDDGPGTLCVSPGRGPYSPGTWFWWTRAAVRAPCQPPGADEPRAPHPQLQSHLPVSQWTTGWWLKRAERRRRVLMEDESAPDLRRCPGLGRRPAERRGRSVGSVDAGSSVRSSDGFPGGFTPVAYPGLWAAHLRLRHPSQGSRGVRAAVSVGTARMTPWAPHPWPTSTAVASRRSGSPRPGCAPATRSSASSPASGSGRPARRVVARAAAARGHDLRRRPRRTGPRRMGAHPHPATHVAPRRARGPALGAARHRVAGRTGLGRPVPSARTRRDVDRAGARRPPGPPRRTHAADAPGAHPRLRRERTPPLRRADEPPADRRRAALGHLLGPAARDDPHLRPRRRDGAARATGRPRRSTTPAAS